MRELKLIRRAFRNWPTLAVAGLLWRHLPLPRRDLTVVTRRGTRFVVPLGPRAGALYPALDIFAFSAYANDWQLEDEPQVVDIGAHVGAFTLWLGEQYADLRVLCFEPDPDAFRYLARNLKGLAATVHQSAVGARSRMATLSRPIPGGGVSSVDATPADGGITVDVVSFDELMDEFTDVSLVKLDCEGSEYEIVLHSSPRAWERVRRVVIEYHAVPGRDPLDVVERLESLGLRLVRAQARAADGGGTQWFSR